MNLLLTASPSPRGADRAKGVTAVLGPTNTGKTHLAVERMLAHSSGIIGLPLRLLAREVYSRVAAKAGADQVALITGEEKIKPKHARYWVSTVEAMPRDLEVAFVAIDEAQLAADLDRGHVFTDRLLNRRGREETLVIGAMTMKRAVEQLLPGANIVSRPRLSKLSFAGERKISRLPRRTAIVAFSAEEVYAIAELIRRQRGGAAVVLGALSPRTRNAQVAMYQNGDVDYIVATDAIGMGLNLDVDHIAFAGERKFDGWQYRHLTPAEFGQIAGRAGRYLRDGTFGSTGRCSSFPAELVEALEEHRFDPVGPLQWRNTDLDFSSIETLQASLDIGPKETGLTRAPIAEDVMVLEIAGRDELVRRVSKTRADVERLWDACQVPDYRKVSPSAHADLVITIYAHIVRAGKIPGDWFSRQLASFDRTDGDIETLSSRIAQVRTWTFVSNRPDWLDDPEHWQGVTRQVEDNLSDALHERLAHRFVDRRTSVLMRRLRENAMLEAEVTPKGDVLVEGQHVGHLHGFRFTPDPQAAGEAAKALNAAAFKALAGEFEKRATKVSEAVDDALVLANDGTIRWLGEAIARITAGEKTLNPGARVLADEQLTGPSLEAVQRRLDLWLAALVQKLLGPLLQLETGTDLEGIGRGIAFQVAEALGVLERSRVADEMRILDQNARAALRKHGLRFGAFHIYLPQLLKPAPRALAAQLWALKHGGVEHMKGLDDVPHFAASGRTSFPADKNVPKGLYRAAGFRVCGDRAVRVDILERLADLIRPAIAYRPGLTAGAPPAGTADRDGFVVTVAMTSLAGCSGEDFASILRSLGYMAERRQGPAITVPLLQAAPVEPVKLVAAGVGANDGPAEVEKTNESVPSGQASIAPGEPACELVVSESAEVLEAPFVAERDTTNAFANSAESESAEICVGSGEKGSGEGSVFEEPGSQSQPAKIASNASTGAGGDPSIQAGNEAEHALIEEAVEPVTIEVWRPHRQQHHAPRRSDHSRGERRQGSRAAGTAENASGSGAPGAPETRSGRRERHGGHRHGGGRGEGAPQLADQVRTGSQAEPRPHEGTFPASAHGPAAEIETGHTRSPGRREAPSHSGRNNPGSRERRPRLEAKPQFASTEKAKRERLPDPDSPFAKLLALKAELENKIKTRKD